MRRVSSIRARKRRRRIGRIPSPNKKMKKNEGEEAIELSAIDQSATSERQDPPSCSSKSRAPGVPKTSPKVEQLQTKIETESKELKEGETMTEASTDFLERIPVERRVNASFVPQKLLFRSEERKQVRDFINTLVAAITKGHGSTLYLLGQPGSGKTALVSEILRDIVLNRVRVVFINAMSLAKPRAKNFYRKFLQDVSPIGFEFEGTNEIAFYKSEANKQLSKAKLSKYLIVIDEVDVFLKEGVGVLEDVFRNWPAMYGIGVVGIANALDMDFQAVRGAVVGASPAAAGGAGNTVGTVRFKPYSSDQLYEIVRARLTESERKEERYISNSALKFCAKKAAASGDARDILNICHRLLTLKSKDGGKASLPDAASVMRADGEKSRSLGAVTSLPLHSKIVLAALLVKMRRRQNELGLSSGRGPAVNSHELRIGYLDVCRDSLVNVQPLDYSEFVEVYEMLAQIGIIEIPRTKGKGKGSASRGSRNAGFSLCIDLEAAAHALQGVKLLAHLFD